MRPIAIPQITKLIKPEKNIIDEELLYEISLEENDIPIPESHKRELERRLKQHHKEPGALVTLKKLQTNVKMRKRPIRFYYGQKSGDPGTTEDTLDDRGQKM